MPAGKLLHRSSLCIEGKVSLSPTELGPPVLKHVLFTWIAVPEGKTGGEALLTAKLQFQMNAQGCLYIWSELA